MNWITPYFRAPNTEPFMNRSVGMGLGLTLGVISIVVVNHLFPTCEKIQKQAALIRKLGEADAQVNDLRAHRVTLLEDVGGLVSVLREQLKPNQGLSKRRINPLQQMRKSINLIAEAIQRAQGIEVEITQVMKQAATVERDYDRLGKEIREQQFYRAVVSAAVLFTEWVVVAYGTPAIHKNNFDYF